MAVTASESSRRSPATRARRLSLRLRLTLLYGGCFLVGGAAVLAVVYVLVARDTRVQTRQLRVPAVEVPSSSRSGAGATVNGSRSRPLITLPTSPESAASPAPRLSSSQLADLRRGAMAMSRCMRARGIRNYPDLKVWRSRRFVYATTDPGPGVVGPGFKADNITCSQLINHAFPGQARFDRQLGRHNAALLAQRQVTVVVDRANGALTTQRRGSLRALLTWSGVALGVMAMVSIVLGWLLAGRALRPMRAMTSRAREITEENLHERLAIDLRDDELGDLAATFDGVLERLERAFAAQRRFVANASHELRTPVTLERTLLEVALADADADAAQLRRACERVLASTERQGQTIEALLTLARSQGGTDVDAPVDLAELAQDAMTLRQQRLADIAVATDLHPAPLSGDPALVERLVANLIDNAIVHNLSDGGWLTVETGHRGSGGWLRVSNGGAEIPRERISDIFEPFRRIDGERTATATGLGLGLSIVQAIADVHGAAIHTRPLDGGGLQVEVRFPAQTRSRGADR